MLNNPIKQLVFLHKERGSNKLTSNDNKFFETIGKGRQHQITLPEWDNSCNNASYVKCHDSYICTEKKS